jgi:hypothetical protein
MKGQTESQQVPRSAGFIREGLREFSRKLERRKLRKLAQQREMEKSAALIALGQHAWQQRIDLSGFAGLHDQISQVEQQAGELSARLQALESEKAGLETRQREETAKFDGQRRSVEEKKRPIDSSLQTARQDQSGRERFIQQRAARHSSVVAELATLEQELAALAAAPDQANRLAAAQARQQRLIAERAKLTGELEQGQAALPAVKAEVDRLTQESQRCQAEIDRVEGERRAAMAPILAELQRVSGELGTVRQQVTATAGVRTEQFKQLGLALFESGSTEPAIAQPMEQTAAAYRARSAAQQALDSSLGLTRAMPPKTMLKFWTTAVLLPVLLIVAGVAGFAGWAWWQERHYAQIYESGRPINPYLSHPLGRHAAYNLANRLASARGEQQVANLMLELFRAIHLGVYTHDGTQILAGAERSQKDFFLYDFQWKTLARAYYAHNLMNFSQHSALLGAALAGMDNPAQMEANLGKAIRLRYQQASQSPNDPNSYLILLVDALARNQLKPYSLSEIGERPAKDLYIDPLQSLLIMLDFFMEEQSSVPTSSSWLHWNLVPSVYAQSPCDAIQGDQGQKYWGNGVKMGAMGFAPAGKAVQITGAMGDLLLLYGITIKITPTNYSFHLRHDEDYIYGFTAKVTFDPEGVPDEAVKCGWLAGKTMPKPSEPLKDVELTWNIEPVWPPYLLVPHEMVQRLTGHLGFQTKTDSDGESDFMVSPTDCPYKNGGAVVGRDLMMTATARVLTTKMPTPGTLGWISLLTKLGPGGLEYLMNGRTGYCRFRVEWHEKKPKGPQR